MEREKMRACICSLSIPRSSCKTADAGAGQGLVRCENPQDIFARQTNSGTSSDEEGGGGVADLFADLVLLDRRHLRRKLGGLLALVRGFRLVSLSLLRTRLHKK